MMKKKHVIAKLLVFAMLLSMLPLSAVAAPADTGSNDAYALISDVKVNGTGLTQAEFPTTGMPNTPYVVGSDSVTVTVGADMKLTATMTISDTNANVYVVDGDTTPLKKSDATVTYEETLTAIPTDAKTVKLYTETSAGKQAYYSLTFKVAKATVAVTGVTLDKTSLELEEGKTATLTATVAPETATNKTVTWSTSEKTVATVTDGKVTAVKAGTATITVTTTDGNKTATCKVTVTAAAADEPGTDEPGTTDENTVTVKPKVDEEEVDGKTVATVKPEDAKPVLDAIEEANKKAGDSKEAVVVKIDVKTADVVKLPGNVFKNVNDCKNEVHLAVVLKKGTVTLNKLALVAIGVDEGVEVTMSLDETDEKDIPEGKKPDTTGTIKAVFDVEITLSDGTIDWGKGTDNKITLTVPTPKGLPSRLSNVAVYLDKDKAPGAKVTKNGNNVIDIAVPHLTIVSLVDEPSTGGTGGGGGGSGKPSVKPGETQTPTAPTTTPSGVAGFSDVSTGSWYAEYVKYVVDKGLFGGVGNGRFAPDDNMTRAMMWTVLARYMGVDTTGGSTWYEAARAWAIAQGISDGTMADGNVTREQFVTMLWRLSGEPAVATSASFTDGGKVSDYAKTAVNWAVAQGIVNGYNDGSFKPQGSATRAEVAKMLTVFCTNAETAQDAG